MSLRMLDEKTTALLSGLSSMIFFTLLALSSSENSSLPELLETQMKILGYETHCNFKFTEKNLGASGMRGVAIYIKDDIKSDEVTIKNDYDDQLWVRIKLRGNDSLLCGCLYRSPTNDQARLKETTDKICGIIEKAVSQKDTHLLICGDFNYPSIDWENEYVEEASSIGSLLRIRW